MSQNGKSVHSMALQERHARAHTIAPRASHAFCCLSWAGRSMSIRSFCGQPIALASNESPAGREVGVVSELYEARVKNGSWHVIEFFFLEW